MHAGVSAQQPPQPLITTSSPRLARDFGARKYSNRPMIYDRQRSLRTRRKTRVQQARTTYQNYDLRRRYSRSGAEGEGGGTTALVGTLH